MRPFPLLAVLLLSLSSVASQADDPQPKLQFQERPKSMEEARERLDKRLAAAEQAYTEAVEQAEAIAVDQMSGLARGHVAQGDLGKAGEAWGEVLAIDPDHESARKFFQAIGRRDVVKQAAGIASSRRGEMQSRSVFRCKSGRIFRRMPNGQWADSGRKGALSTVNALRSGVILKRETNGEIAWLGDAYMWRDEGDTSLWHLVEFGEWVR